MKQRWLLVMLACACSLGMLTACGSSDSDGTGSSIGLEQAKEEASADDIELSAEETENVTETAGSVDSDVQSEQTENAQVSEDAEQNDETDETVEAEKETEYGDGTYLIEVQTDGGYYGFEFQDGDLLHEEWEGSFDTFGGKNSFGYYNSIEESPRYGMTVEEVLKMLEDNGYEPTIEKE